jgi:hypothetical protein
VYQFRFLVEEGRAGSPKMMSVGLHCRLARPGRVAGLSEFLDFVKSYKRDIWVCTREQIADFWIENHSPRGAGSPVKAISDNVVTEEESSSETAAGEVASAADDNAPEFKKLETNEPSEEGDII